MTHSKKIEETALWQIYASKCSTCSKRSLWVKEVYENAIRYLLDVRQTFKNYTLHDETHVLNVLDAMGGLLGDYVEYLTIGEMELLILAACLHDLGMVYTDEEKQQCYEDEIACRKFLKEFCPELLGHLPEEWTEDIRQWYLRTLHPFRLPEVLLNKEWKELFERCPLEVVPKRCILAVCLAHGENPKNLNNNKDLEYLSANDVSPLFCALLLRLGDLLDFDDTRAPKVLYNYVECNEKSRAEWDKHQASAGFRYFDTPSTNDLPYKARCTNPGIEHAIRDFLDWIDDELNNCVKLQKYCNNWQQKFPFPRAVLRDEIEADGYMSGDFCLTMDQTQILKLLTGKDIYDSPNVFVRELLQNAIDAVLLRGEMEHDFIPEDSRIDLWEWNDKEGNIWFRIDDQGTGMTLGMLQRYFLKVGNSYYTSRELEKDLYDCNQTKIYRGISCFGIGFLSCFLCGDYIEVSTLYFDSKKCRREEQSLESYQTVHYGLRLQITGLTGYYTLSNQAKQHPVDRPLAHPDYFGLGGQFSLERNGYRTKPGTSIVIRLIPGKVGSLDLRKAAEKYLCGAKIPVYYNNKRIGRTYCELMQIAHKMSGKKFYELPLGLKRQFDDCFPALCGQYPQIAVTVIPLDTEEDHVLQGLSGILVKNEVCFDYVPQWKIKDQLYEIRSVVWYENNVLQFILFSTNSIRDLMFYGIWEKLRAKYEVENVAALEAKLERMSVCPDSIEQLGDVWYPFEEKMDLYMVWGAYHDFRQYKEMKFSVTECGCQSINEIVSNNRFKQTVCSYNGIAFRIALHSIDYYECAAIFLLENEWSPTIHISRSEISGLPLKVLLAISGILKKYEMLGKKGYFCGNLEGWGESTLKEWREVRTSQIEEWMKNNLADIIETRQELEKAQGSKKVERDFMSISIKATYGVLYKYLISYFQDNYQMTINYEEGQRVSFCERKEREPEDIYDIFPPMMFCKGASDRDRRYICCSEALLRRCITVDHPFTVWLLENSVQLNCFFKRQFQQIVHSLCNDDAKNVIQKCNNIRKQMLTLLEHHGVNVSLIPELSENDFWENNK